MSIFLLSVICTVACMCGWHIAQSPCLVKIVRMTISATAGTTHKVIIRFLWFW